MKRLIVRMGAWFLRQIFRIRYKITYRGLDTVKAALKGNKNGLLVLPNHPAIFIDPLIACFPILAPLRLRPLVTEYIFFSPLLHWLMGWVRALPVPNFATGVNPLKLSRLDKTLKAVEEGLPMGEAFLIYPAGMTKQGAREIIGGAFAVHQLLSKFPETRVVLVRTVGLWGSRFSRAYTKGRQIETAEALHRSFIDILKAFIFFLPRREVTVEFEMAPAALVQQPSKNQMNRFLEQWYNKPFENTTTKGEPLTFVPYSRWRHEEVEIELAPEESIEGKIIPKEVEEEVYRKIAELADVPASTLTPAKHLVADLCLDSLNIAELITFLETRYDVKQIDPQSLGTVAAVLLAATRQLEILLIKEPDWDITQWEEPRKPERMYIGEGHTLPDVFFDVSDRYLHEIAAADPTSGPVSYHTIRSRVILLSYELAKLPGRHIGILLPSSLAAHILILACQLAGKVPVMINWTIGGRHLESVLQLSKIESVLTSWAFLDRLDNVDLRPIQHILTVLEEMKAGFSWWNLLTAPLKASFPSRWIRRFGWAGVWSKLQGESEAVILFTSGTENMPKGVPLTHKNLLSNMRSALMVVDFFSTDRLLSPLPPFHSFGFAVLGLLPLLAGVRVFFSPNPADAGAQARVIRKWGITIICSAPPFLINILKQGRKEPFEAVRLAVSGAEKAPNELADLAARVVPDAALWEGYGITECSPILTINSADDRACGVGKPLPGGHVRIVNADDFSKPMEHNQSGMILASGPNIFHGYLQTDVTSPFYIENGCKWYVTGDIGYLNDQGNLFITGRLKRFIKIGGEMVSLGAIEAALNDEPWLGTGEGPQLAVCTKEELDGRPRLTLFCTKDVGLTDINVLLRKKGFSNLVRIDSVVNLPEIPLSGTGKVAYRELENLLNAR